MGIYDQARIAAYCVEAGWFQLAIKVLSIDKNMSFFGPIIGSGGFGKVIEQTVNDKPFVAKFREMKAKQLHLSLPEWIEEVAIGKICSLLEIGPEVETRIPFDLIVFKDGGASYIKKCLPVAYPVDINKLEGNISRCLEILHAFHFVHCDIKPGNILWDEDSQQYLLCDFGISRYVKEKQGERTLISRCGTDLYMGEEMRSLENAKDKTGLVDLYRNDWEGLQGSIIELINKQPSPTKSYHQDVSSSEFLTTTSEVDSERTSKVTEAQASQQNRASNEFYQVLNIATSPTEHSFNLRDNLQKMCEE